MHSKSIPYFGAFVIRRIRLLVIGQIKRECSEGAWRACVPNFVALSVTLSPSSQAAEKLTRRHEGETLLTRLTLLTLLTMAPALHKPVNKVNEVNDVNTVNCRWQAELRNASAKAHGTATERWGDAFPASRSDGVMERKAPTARPIPA